MEHENLRLQVARLDEAFPGREMLRICDVARFCGWNVKTVKNHFKFSDGFISKLNLARAMCKGA